MTINGAQTGSFAGACRLLCVKQPKQNRPDVVEPPMLGMHTAKNKKPHSTERYAGSLDPSLHTSSLHKIFHKISMSFIFVESAL